MSTLPNHHELISLLLCQVMQHQLRPYPLPRKEHYPFAGLLVIMSSYT